MYFVDQKLSCNARRSDWPPAKNWHGKSFPAILNSRTSKTLKRKRVPVDHARLTSRIPDLYVICIF